MKRADIRRKVTTMTSIKEWREILDSLDPNQPIPAELLQDKRKGALALVERHTKKQHRAQVLKEQYEQMLRYENEAKSNGKKLIAGLDEAGRGPLAGPVVAAAAILPEDFYLPGLNDSKKIGRAQRELFFEEIMKHADVGVGIIEAEEIDQINILNASKKAMEMALTQLKSRPDHALIDAVELRIPISQKSIIKGDAKSVSIAAASIVAKVTRDRLMEQAAERFPEYGFDNHAGYGTKQHVEALHKYGPTDIHRLSFEPVKSIAAKRR
ncbi:ribonuclease HII [Jeotgalibacillus aurantiacus]|uniref:ribonuclease HII n=1 Tax=Jeotgalibacillus aurantiacus TaxID=2763266 RepID=UPI001D0B947E|nr:ribonuclease HII [Jeotgalibacillus aurantiacus]